ncbi:hypothetical protein BDV23DRAFT_150506 [Aspergillus alliaceus]|uniref:Uncharacterized protein n=1 Tax=Petromyces alliaceus TaxID=209559 RepID=A0A5N7CF69_PETAA|nr:hypothetical protein BDV23DRAFT_150506 [Aspergillus alliaceus]
MSHSMQQKYYSIVHIYQQASHMMYPTIQHIQIKVHTHNPSPTQHTKIEEKSIDSSYPQHPNPRGHKHPRKPHGSKKFPPNHHNAITRKLNARHKSQFQSKLNTTPSKKEKRTKKV